MNNMCISLLNNSVQNIQSVLINVRPILLTLFMYHILSKSLLLIFETVIGWYFTILFIVHKNPVKLGSIVRVLFMAGGFLRAPF